jgi:tyrocidine synthetase-3
MYPESGVGARRAVPELINRFIRPFDLSQAPLLRVGLVRDDSGEKTSHLLVVDMHHIISDGISSRVLKMDFISLFNGEELSPLRLQYRDFSQWQNSEKQRAAFAAGESFWLNEFAGELPSLNLPIDYPRQEMRDLAGSAVEFALGVEQTGALKELALREGVTMQIIMLAILNVLFFKVCGQEDIIIGTPAAGRRHADLLDVIGLFVNTMALRNYPKAEKSFREFLREVGERSLSAYDNQDYPFDDLVGKVRQNRDRSRSPLFDVMFEIHTNLDEPDGKTGTKEERDTDEAASPSNNPGRDVTKMDIDWYGIESRRRIDFIVFYSTRLFKRETIERLTRHYVEIIEQVLADSEIKLKDIALSHSFVTAQSTVSQEDEGDFGF